MSECQRREIAPVDPDELANVRVLSTWTRIPRTSFVNEYDGQVLRGDAKHLGERRDLTAEYRRRPALPQRLSAACL